MLCPGYIARPSAALLLVACGGAPPEDASGIRVAEAQTSVEAPAPIAAAEAGSASAPQLDTEPRTPQLASGSAGGYRFVILKERAVYEDLDRLEPRHGSGYEPLQAFLYLNGKGRAKSPLASIKPICRTSMQCEYLPPRAAGFADSYTISIDDSSIAQLSADRDVVVISARQLQLEKPATVLVTLTIPGQPPIVKRILYGAATS